MSRFFAYLCKNLNPNVDKDYKKYPLRSYYPLRLSPVLCTDSQFKRLFTHGCRQHQARLLQPTIFRTVQRQLFHFRSFHRSETYTCKHKRQISDFNRTTTDKIHIALGHISLSLLFPEMLLEYPSELHADDRPEFQSRHRTH